MSKAISKDATRLIVSHAIFTGGRVLNNIFLNLFIWKVTNSLQAIAIFQISFLFFHTFFFGLWSYRAKKGNLQFLRGLALAGMAVFYMVLILLEEQAAEHLVLLAFGLSLFNPLYWLTYHTLSFDITNTKNRSHYLGIESALTTVTKVITPIIGGALIVYSPFGLGYTSVFTLAFVFLVLAYLVGNIEPPKAHTGSMHLRKTWKQMCKHKDILKMLSVNVFSNLGHRGALEKILIFLLFDVLQHEFHLGGWLSFFTFVATVSSWYVGKHLSNGRYKRSVFLGSTLLASSLLFLIGVPHFVTYVVFSIVKEVVTPFIRIPRQVYGRNLLHLIPDYKSHRIEFFVIREIFSIGIGRLTSYVILLPVISLSSGGLKAILVVMAFSILLVPLMISLIKTDLDTLV